MFSDLITSQSRIKLLNVFLAFPLEMYHVRELVRRTGDEINAVRRELSFWKKKVFLKKSHEQIEYTILFPRHINFIMIYWKLVLRQLG